jgi:hypothetical protein
MLGAGSAPRGPLKPTEARAAAGAAAASRAAHSPQERPPAPAAYRAKTSRTPARVALPRLPIPRTGVAQPVPGVRGTSIVISAPGTTARSRARAGWPVGVANHRLADSRRRASRERRARARHGLDRTVVHDQQPERSPRPTNPAVPAAWEAAVALMAAAARSCLRSEESAQPTVSPLLRTTGSRAPAPGRGPRQCWICGKGALSWRSSTPGCGIARCGRDGSITRGPPMDGRSSFLWPVWPELPLYEPVRGWK